MKVKTTSSNYVVELDGGSTDAVDSLPPPAPIVAPAPAPSQVINQINVQSTCYDWTPEQVASWLKESGLEEMKSR